MYKNPTQREGFTVDTGVNELANIGKTMARIRKSQTKKWTQKMVADQLGVERSVYTKYENGVVNPSEEAIKKFAEIFHVKEEDLIRQVSVAIPDTSALIKNKRLLTLLLEDYKQVVIPDTVQIELDKAKDRGNKAGWQILMSIPEFKKKYPDKFRVEKSEHFKEGNRDAKIRCLATSIEKKEKVDVYIIHDDTGFTNMYDKGLLLRDYMASRSKNENYAAILALDEEYRHLDAEYYKEADKWNLDEYLPDGSTLLISCIRHNYDIRAKKEGTLVPDSDRMKKIRFLLEHGADINKTDGKEYCFTPLAHCVQIDDFQAFDLLLKYGADFNKGSIDEANTSYFKTQNEGNTPLMVACWHGRKRFMEKLCEQENICLNQQDGNGYTALMKCAIQRGRRRKKGLKCYSYESMYNYLLSKGADNLIRDRKNRTAKQLWREGDESGD